MCNCQRLEGFPLHWGGSNVPNCQYTPKHYLWKKKKKEILRNFCWRGLVKPDGPAPQPPFAWACKYSRTWLLQGCNSLGSCCRVAIRECLEVCLGFLVLRWICCEHIAGLSLENKDLQSNWEKVRWDDYTVRGFAWKTQSFDLGASFWSGLTPSDRCQWFYGLIARFCWGKKKLVVNKWFDFWDIKYFPPRPVKASWYSESYDSFLHTKNTRSCQTSQLWVDSSQTLSHILSRIGLCYRPTCVSYTNTGWLRTNTHSDWQLWDFLSNCLTVPEEKKKENVCTLLRQNPT